MRAEILKRREGKLIVRRMRAELLVSARTTEPSLCTNSTIMFAEA